MQGVHASCSLRSYFQLLVKLGYTSLTLQIGRGNHTPQATPLVPGLDVSWYRYKPTLAPDMKQASLIISHGGMRMEGVVTGHGVVGVCEGPYLPQGAPRHQEQVEMSKKVSLLKGSPVVLSLINIMPCPSL